jgi:predicted nucleic acid-binding protein
MDQAIAIARLYQGKSNVEIVPMDDDALRMALLLLERYRLGRKRISDALLAGALIAHDVPEIITRNADDFAPFSEIRVIDPVGSSSRG